MHEIRRKLATLLIVAMSININSFAAIVSDNDGSAFVTKAEFDALKASFNKQIDDYNSSIDGKIDGAIASYLSGIALVITRDEEPLVGKKGTKLTFFTPNDDLEYEFAPLQISGNATRVVTGGYNYNDNRWATVKHTRTMGGFALVECHLDPSNSRTDRFQKKTAITDLDKTLKIAKWDGFYEKCQDKVVFKNYTADTYLFTIAEPEWGEFLTHGLHLQNSLSRTDVSLEGLSLMGLCGYKEGIGNTGMTSYAMESLDASFLGKSENIYAALFNFDYDMFSNMERTENWSYPGTYQDAWDGYPIKGNYLGATDSDVCCDIMNYSTGGKGRYLVVKFGDLSKDVNTLYTATPSGTYLKQAINITEADIPGGKFFTPGSGTQNSVYIPAIGFETKYLKNWGSIYNTNYDQYITAGATSVVTDASSKKHMRMTNGVPLVQLKKGEGFTYTFDFEDKTKDYWIWMKDSPFLNETNILPATNETTLDLQNCGTKINGAYKIINGTGQVRYTNNTENDQIIYLKFASGGTAAPSSYDTIDGGTLILDYVLVHKPD